MNQTQANFKIGDYTLTNFIDLSELDLLEILEWRNEEQTRRWMKNSQIISKIQHLQYCENLKNTQSVGHWLVKYENSGIGVISLNSIDFKERFCEWGFYLNPKYFLGDAALRIFNAAEKLFFENFDLLKLIGSVKVKNRSALMLNDFFGMKEVNRLFIDSEEYSFREINQITWIERSITDQNLKTEFAKFIKNNYRNENRK
jgi:UDP-4-amino-4,6-dideoxy-N-acetyl-beta-L-altrosamine N-acetyltransferase